MAHDFGAEWIYDDAFRALPRFFGGIFRLFPRRSSWHVEMSPTCQGEFWLNASSSASFIRSFLIVVRGPSLFWNWTLALFTFLRKHVRWAELNSRPSIRLTLFKTKKKIMNDSGWNLARFLLSKFVCQGRCWHFGSLLKNTLGIPRYIWRASFLPPRARFFRKSPSR